nr:exonuclease mut-7 homolog [Ipomoea batatas]
MDLSPSIHFVSSTNSPEFTLLTRALTRSSVIGLDAEWKPVRTQQSSFPTVSILQIACQVDDDDEDPHVSNNSPPVFLLDLSAIPLPSIYEILRDAFVSPNILKLGFRFKQDLVYLSSTFCSQGCEPGFDRVEPFLDITSIYSYLQHMHQGRRLPKQSKSLAAICQEVLGISLSKELQCSDWSQRPLTEEQKLYAAVDSLCLIQIFDVLKARVANIVGSTVCNVGKLQSPSIDLGLKQILDMPNGSDNILLAKFIEATKMVQAISTDFPQGITIHEEVASTVQFAKNKQMDDAVLWIARKYGDKILLSDSDRKPKMSKKKGKKPPAGLMAKPRQLDGDEDWQGPPPWDVSLGGDGCPKFLCDVMVEGLAKHLRCVGIDAAVPPLKKPQTRDLIEQASKEKRVLVTRDAKLLRHGYLIENQVYRVKSLLKNEQLIEVIETFKLEISEDQLMSRCTKCNGRFIQKPLTTEEAVEAAKGFQVIPKCLFNKNLEFWQCMDCKQLYWEGTQYCNAVQKFIDICKLNE